MALFVPWSARRFSSCFTPSEPRSALLGVIGGIWAEKFDHIAAVTNFVGSALLLLSGTFWSSACRNSWHAWPCSIPSST